LSIYHEVFGLLQGHCVRAEAALLEMGVNARVNVEEDFVFCDCLQQHDALLQTGIEIPVLVESVPECGVEMLGVTVVVVPCARFSIPLWKTGEIADAAFVEKLNVAFSRIVLASAAVQKAASDIERERLEKN